MVPQKAKRATSSTPCAGDVPPCPDGSSVLNENSRQGTIDDREGTIMDINAVIIRGTVATTPQEGRTPSGAREISARIKMVEHSDGREFATWYPVRAYGKSAEALLGARVGTVVAVTGKLACDGANA